MAKLNMIHGLFEVVDGIWQVRGYDLSVMSIIRSNTGYIVIDPFISAEVSKTVWEELVVPKLGDKPVVAVIFTHSHVDHFGGVRTFVSDADLTVRQGEGPRARGFHARGRRRECDRRQCDEPARQLHVRQSDRQERDRTGRWGPRQNHLEWHGGFRRAEPVRNQNRRDDHTRRDRPQSHHGAGDPKRLRNSCSICRNSRRFARRKTRPTLCTISIPCAARKCATACCGRNICKKPWMCSATTCRSCSPHIIGRPGATIAASLS